MYLDYWKLARRPFDERIDPQWFFASGVHRGMRLLMRTIVEQRKPVAMIVGGVGSGKSMVAGALADSFSERHPAITLVNPTTVSDTLQGILGELQHSAPASADESELRSRREAILRPNVNGFGPSHYEDGGSNQPGSVQALERLKRQLARRSQAGQHVVAFLDAADAMPDTQLRKLLDTLRDLAVHDTPAMTAFVIGSPELLIRTRRVAPDSERLFPQCVLAPMAPADTALYIRHRIQRASGDPEIFSTACIELVSDLCGGVPRRINRLCDLCLLVGYSRNCERITEGLAWIAQREMSVLAASRTAAAAPTRRWRPLGRCATSVT